MELGTRDTIIDFALTGEMRLCLRRDLWRRVWACVGGALVFAICLLMLFASVRPQLYILAWCGIIMAMLSLGRTVPALYWTRGDLRAERYARRSGAFDLRRISGKKGGTIRYELQMTGRYSTIPRDTYHALQDMSYAILEETPSGTLLRVRDFAGCVQYQRWEGCDFPPQEGDPDGVGASGPAPLKRAIPPLFAGIDRD